MASSSINTIELVFGMGNNEPFERKLTTIEEAAKNMVEGIKESFEKVKDYPKKALESLEEFGSSSSAGFVNKGFDSAIKDFKKWMRKFGKLIKKEREKEYSDATESLFSPITAYFDKLKYGVHDLAKNISSKTSEMYKSITEKVKDAYTSFYDATLGRLGDIYHKKKKEFIKEHKVLVETFEGLYLGLRVYVWTRLKIASEILTYIGKGIKAFISIGTTAIETMKKTIITIAAAGKVLKDFGEVLMNKAISVASFIGKISGITLALKGLQKAATIALTVTGIGAAFSLIREFTSGSEEQIGSMWGAFNVIAETIRTAFDPISSILYQLAVSLSQVVEKVLRPFFKSLAEILKLTLIYFDNLMQKSKGFNSAIASMQSLIESFAKMMVKLVTFIMDKVVPNLFPLFEKIIEGITGIYNNLFPLIEGLGKEVAPVLENIVQELIPAINLILTEIVEVFKELTQQVSSTLLTWIPKIQKAFKEDIMPQMKEFLVAVSKLVKSLIPVFTFLIKTVSVFVIKVLPILLAGTTEMLKVLTKIVVFITETLGPAFKKYGDGVTQVFSDMLDDTGSFFSWLWKSNKYAFDSSKKLFEKIAEGFNWVSRKIMKVYDAFVQYLDPIKTFIDYYIFDPIKKGFNAVWSYVKPLKDFIIESMLSTAKIISEALSSAFSKAFTAIKSILVSIKADIDEYVIKPLLSAMKYTPAGILGGIITKSTPKFSEGGIVTKMTPAIIGENGPEVVLPLKRETIDKFISPQIKIPESIKLDADNEFSRKIIALVSETNKILLSFADMKNKPVSLRTKPDNIFSIQGFQG